MRFRIGDKVVPHSKTRGSSGLETSNNWKNVKENGQNFLYINQINGREIVAGRKKGGNGDYFNEEDLEYFDKEGLHEAERW